MYAVTYDEVLNQKFSRILADANDKQLKRVFPFLIKRNDSWQKIERAVKVRIDKLIASLDIEDLIGYRLLKLASINANINSVLQARFETFDSKERRKILETTPLSIMKIHVIKLFVESGSFDSAHNYGVDILVPHGEFLDDDLESRFSGIIDNNTWNINQILNAGGIDEDFCNLYRKTKIGVGSHGALWKDFFEQTQSEGFNYLDLKELLIADGEIEGDPENIDEDDEPPF